MPRTRREAGDAAGQHSSEGIGEDALPARSKSDEPGTFAVLDRHHTAILITDSSILKNDLVRPRGFERTMSAGEGSIGYENSPLCTGELQAML
jgi:hypothetical protein